MRRHDRVTLLYYVKLRNCKMKQQTLRRHRAIYNVFTKLRNSKVDSGLQKQSPFCSPIFSLPPLAMRLASAHPPALVPFSTQPCEPGLLRPSRTGYIDHLTPSPVDILLGIRMADNACARQHQTSLVQFAESVLPSQCTGSKDLPDLSLPALLAPAHFSKLYEV
ncbi:hypothetical protein MRB53_041522 [Persea americana]|nr:hypothetical protein MRB53_041522 [Persea americana]